MVGVDCGEMGYVRIGGEEVGIKVDGKGNYKAYSFSGREILQISNDDNGISSFTQEKEGDMYKL